ncbi:P-loop containing nucleoside triphosphate hydrolase protein [Limtongia smithiae]|uniref:P-loop containing nucleoside triphosphate hydrolase protein n=1 Tax=Limtongia smithiae TaxID=1125753 RepID=UPI0034CD3602
MQQLFCPSPSWDVDDFNLCVRERYFQVLFPLLAVLGSVACLLAAGTVRLPERVCKLWRKSSGYSRLPTDASQIDLAENADDDTENADPIYRLRTHDASAEYTDVESIAGADSLRDVEGDALDISPRAVAGTRGPDTLVLDSSNSRRTRSVLEVTITAMLAAVHVLVVFGVFVAQYPAFRVERIKLEHSVIVNALLALYVLTLAVVRLSPSVRYQAPYLRIHVAVLYLFVLLISVVNFRSAIVHSTSKLVSELATFDVLAYLSLFIIALLSPIRDRPIYIETDDGLDPNPMPYATIAQTVTFAWADHLLMTGYRRPLVMKDVYDLKDDCRSVLLMPPYRLAKGAHSMLYGLLKCFQWKLVYGFCFSSLYAIFTFAPTIMVRQILRFLENPEAEPVHMAWLYVIALLVCALINSILSAQALWTFREVCVRARAIIVAELYSKALKRKVSIDVPSTGTAALEAEEESSKKESKDKAAIEDGAIDLGRVINLMAVDAFSIAEVLARMNPLIKGVMMIFISMVLLYQTLGVSAIAGSLCMLTLLPINYKFSRAFGRIQKELLAITDRRIQKTNEILQSIKIIKFFAWEERFSEQLQEVRNEELAKLRQRFFILAFAAMVWFGFPTVITFITFGFYTLIMKQELTPSVAFSALSLFNIMRTPMDRLAEMITNVIEAKTSVDRVQKFLDEEETQKYSQLRMPRHGDPTIGFKQASFSWSKTPSSFDFKLQDLDISFKPEKLTVIVGPTGAGKTSMLMALLGEMNLLKGRVFLPTAGALESPVVNKATGFTESIAYGAQQPWLLNGSVRENILFGNKYNERRYKHVVQLCALIRDFEILDAGDQTQVGEKGISLSGGQKQRISLARCLYSPARHLILDDCLSAVDSHTALYLYENCLTGPLMKGRTCILVSHNVALTLQLADHVVVLENGRIIQQGNPADVVSSGVLGSDELLINSIQNSRDISRVPSSVNVATTTTAENKDAIEVALEEPSPDAQDKEVLNAKKKQSEETQQVGMVKFSVYFEYIKSMGGKKFWTIVITAIVLHQAGAITQSWWVKVWSAAMATVENLFHGASVRETSVAASARLSQVFEMISEAGVRIVILPLFSGSEVAPAAFTMSSEDLHIAETKSPIYYLIMYGLIAIVYIVLSFAREILFYMGSLSASKALFDAMLHTVMRAKPRFFDSTPVGRIINRFSKDIESIDREVAVDGLSFFHSILSVCVIIGVISWIVPTFLIIGFLISALFFLINVFYLQSSRELKRMQSVTRSPIYQHFGETLVGVSTIRAYGYEQRFIADSMHKVDTNTRPYWLMWALNRWMCVRTDITGGLVSFFAGVFILMSRNTINSGLAGLILTYAITFTENMFWVVLLYATNEMNMNSVERIDEFLQIEQEADDIVPDHRPPRNWPAQGAISVKDLTLRYAPELPRVIKGISFDVAPCSKIGIVGRTGAGKSTIASAFFRFLEADTGSITVDGIDISTIGLHDLRMSLTIIPQDPTLFTGTIRSNLDPFDAYSDSDIFSALRHVHLIDNEAEAAAGSSSSSDDATAAEREARDMNVFYRLDSPVTEGGNNLSQGQRQLMCLARSLLKAPKIILLDEATASIDYHTDALIQETIRKEFAATTILTIAHRLRSIIDYDKILVLDAGLIKEYEAPHVLLQQPDSIFRSMCASSGELETLEELAKASYEEKNKPPGL